MLVARLSVTELSTWPTSSSIGRKKAFFRFLKNPQAVEIALADQDLQKTLTDRGQVLATKLTDRVAIRMEIDFDKTHANVPVRGTLNPA